jgi:hypothetical protein
MTCGYENPTFQVGCRHPKKQHFGLHPSRILPLIKEALRLAESSPSPLPKKKETV